MIGEEITADEDHVAAVCPAQREQLAQFGRDQAGHLGFPVDSLDNLPPYLTWFWPANLDSCLAQGALTLAGVTSRDCRGLLDDAETVLGRAATDPVGTPRDAVFHSAWLTRAHVAAGDLDRAVPAGQAARRRPPTVRSRRCAQLLHRLEADLAALPPRRCPTPVRSLHDQLRATHAA